MFKELDTPLRYHFWVYNVTMVNLHKLIHELFLIFKYHQYNYTGCFVLTFIVSNF